MVRLLLIMMMYVAVPLLMQYSHTIKATTVAMQYCVGESQVNEFNEIDPEQIILLSKLINAESVGESMIDKLRTGSVVLNRMKSKEFPNTMWGVIYQKHINSKGKLVYQFPSIHSNHFVYTGAMYDSKRAAMLLLREGPVLPETVVYFMNPKIADSNWAKYKFPDLFVKGYNHWYYN